VSDEVVVRYWAAAKAAAGVAEESYAAQSTLEALLAAVRSRHPDGRLAEVLQRCSYLVDEVSPGAGRDPADVDVPAGAVVDVLPPFAGGSSRHGRAGDAVSGGTPAPSPGLGIA
jgi:molybdopterin converting factor small subunit